jgi:hypothetical protein
MEDEVDVASAEVRGRNVVESATFCPHTSTVPAAWCVDAPNEIQKAASCHFRTGQ